ncbi:hypothetical protein KC207_05795 [Phycicoccus sp. BSK3Z-2]|uniref:Uncharacterized protein n=1 Tax=Phycicoccus avicenniae TaxID=2828860 RepID=A0A941D810_9MICO|nr:hypothetical protein [Phycicoccus avicenniae]MBR7742803.1 hypothetical protein [Phycicoccus avicenniae]
MRQDDARDEAATRDLDPVAVQEFSQALRAAVGRSGLSLDRVRSRLAERDLPVSTATLSHWQTGRSRPAPGRSLAVVAALEGILGLPDGGLVALLPPAPRPRGRSAHASPPDDGGRRALPLWEEISQAVAELGLTLDDTLRIMSWHEVADVGPDRLVVAHRVSTVQRAVVDGVDRLPMFYSDLSPHDALPRLVPRAGVRVGREVRVGATGLVVAEFVLPAPLAAGERAFLQWDVEHVPVPVTELEMRSAHPSTEVVISARFSPDAFPAEVLGYTEVDGVGRTRRVGPDPLGEASVIRHRVPAGAVGLHWRWPPA